MLTAQQSGRHSIFVRRAAWVAVALAVAGFSTYIGLTGGRASGESRPPQTWGIAEARPEGSPQPLTDQQCNQARLTLEAVRADGAEKASARNEPAAGAALAAEVANSLRWVDAGCPPDAVRGFYPDASGIGGSLRLMEHQVFSSDGPATWELRPVQGIPTPP